MTAATTETREETTYEMNAAVLAKLEHAFKVLGYTNDERVSEKTRTCIQAAQGALLEVIEG